ncbi:MAG: hypothetical protein M3Q07_26800, partial [Pseudobdellovibrionaceae bacterium]|nr:hypothetical protein [Pseudobdellovibrionaceae bacterium]
PVATLTSLSTLAPLGQTQLDYQDRIVYQDAVRVPEARPNFPNYALIGPQARIIVPLYTRQTPIRVRSFPLAESKEYTMCWQPMAEPVDGRCYQELNSQAADASFHFPRGRLIFSAVQSMALDVEYALSDQVKFKLADAVHQYPVHRLPRGESLSVDLGRLSSTEYVPLRINVWGIHGASSNPQAALLDLKILAPDGSLRHQERIALDNSLSEYDRPNGDLVLLNQPNSIYINANVGGGRLVISSPGQDIFANFMLRRSAVPVFARIQPGGYRGADTDRDSWSPIHPIEPTPKDVVASYLWNRGATFAEAQRVSYPSLEINPGAFALTPGYIQEQTLEERKKTGRYVRLTDGASMRATVEGSTVLPLIAFAKHRGKGALLANGQALWQGDVYRSAVVENLDVSRLPAGSNFDLQAQGAEIFLSGVRTDQPAGPVYSKRFFYAQNQGTYLIRKESPQQTLTVEVLLTEAPGADASVSLEVQPGKLASAPVTRELTLLKRDYTMEPNRFAPDTILLDGRQGQLLTIPIPLRSDIPLGDHMLKVKTAGLKGAYLAVSSLVPNFGIRIHASPDASQAIGDSE